MNTKTVEPLQVPEPAVPKTTGPRSAESIRAVRSDGLPFQADEPNEQAAPELGHLWELRAACRGPHQQIFYPPTRFERRIDKRRREERAKEICRSCTVVDTCLEQAIERREPYGIWGGLTELERREHAALQLQTT